MKANFHTPEGYDEGKLIKVKWGVIWSPPVYNPLKEHSIYYRLFLSADDAGNTTPDRVSEAFVRCMGVAPTSVNLNGDKQCCCVYFNSSIAWLSALRRSAYVVRSEADDAFVVFRTVLAFSTTSNPLWSKLFVGGLPNNCNEYRTCTFLQRASNFPIELVGLIRDRKSGKIHNYGFLFVSSLVAADALVNLSGTVIGSRPLRIEAAVRAAPAKGALTL